MWANTALLFACVAIAGGVSLIQGQDANWDLQNYHFYNPWSWLHGRIFDWDIAAAQLQTFFNPLLDVPFYAMVTAGWDPRAITFALALPAGVGAWFLAKIAWLMFDDLDAPRRIGATLASLAVGLTSAPSVAMLGITMNEWPGAALTLGALWLVLRQFPRGAAAMLPVTTLVGAGLLVGIGSGLKLTVATFAVGFCIALLLRHPWSIRRIREAFVFSVAVVAGLAITFGPWAWQLWTHFQNPIFPFANQWIRSPWWDLDPVFDRVYGPHKLREWFVFPWRLLAPGAGYVSEIRYVDARIPLLYSLAILALAGAAIPRLLRRRAQSRPPPDADVRRFAWSVLAVFWVASFLLWTAQHSIVRYIVVLDVLTGVLIVGLLRMIVRPNFVTSAVAVVAVLLIATTRWPDWWHVDYGPRWFDVRVPPVEANALVLLMTNAPMAYVLPFFPPDARHLGVRNNINDPNRKSLLQQAVARAIRDHRGPIYALALPNGNGTEDLAAYRLRRVASTCTEVRTNMRMSPIELCRLERLGLAEQQ
jgi:hypothetical protein